MDLTPTIVLVKEGMLYPVLGKSDANWGIVSIAIADNFYTCPFAMPTLTVESIVSGGPCVADGAM